MHNIHPVKKLDKMLSFLFWSFWLHLVKTHIWLSNNMINRHTQSVHVWCAYRSWTRKVQKHPWTAFRHLAGKLQVSMPLVWWCLKYRLQQLLVIANLAHQIPNIWNFVMPAKIHKSFCNTTGVYLLWVVINWLNQDQSKKTSSVHQPKNSTMHSSTSVQYSRPGSRYIAINSYSSWELSIKDEGPAFNGIIHLKQWGKCSIPCSLSQKIMPVDKETKLAIR